MIVYGDPSYQAKFSEMWEKLRQRTARAGASLDDLRALLIQAGELEQAAGDGLPQRLGPAQAQIHLQRSEELTDEAARAFLQRWGGGKAEALARMKSILEREVPDVVLRVKVPEGFAFYGLYPEQYALAARHWAMDHAAASSRRAVVVGIRSIGTSLSAAVAATLAAEGWTVHRLTVRPTGHPFDRRVEFARLQVRDAAYGLVVDEGPGLSGSSMAAAAAALAEAGLERNCISFLPGHDHAPGGEASEGVREWWRSVRRYVVGAEEIRWQGRTLLETLGALTPGLSGSGRLVERIEDLSGGRWRKVLYASQRDWPAACAAFERTKYRCLLAGGGAVLWKFVGFGELAEKAMARLENLAQKGWSQKPLGQALGFVALPWVEGRPLSRGDAGPEVLELIGRYLADAAGSEMSVEEQQASLARLREMLYWNTREALGEKAAERARAWGEEVQISAKAVARYGDGRMGPWEFVRTASGRIVKADALGHEVDHTVIGRQPLAWDVAGAMVEWGLADVRDAELAFYRAAYAAFRMGQCWLCAQMSGGDLGEQARLREASAFYRGQLERMLGEWERGDGERAECKMQSAKCKVQNEKEGGLRAG